VGDQLRAARKDFDGAKHLNETLAAEVEGLRAKVRMISINLERRRARRCIGCVY